MLRVALSQLRTHGRRFIAVGLAIMLAVAFLVSTLLVSSSTKASLAASLGESYHRAGLVAAPVKSTENFTAQDVKTLTKVPGVQTVYGQSNAMTLVDGHNASFLGMVQNSAPAELESARTRSGHLPGGTGEVAVDASTAGQFRLSVGSVLKLQPAGAADEGTGAGKPEPITLKVSGILEPSSDPLRGSFAQLLAPASVVSQLSGGEDRVSMIQLKLAPGADLGQVKQEASKTLAAGPVAAAVRTPEEAAVAQVQQFTDGQDQLTVVLLAFAVIALFVSALVVSNTFSVIIAQRTRELALLRCIGATRSQIRSSVLVEAAIVGLVSSVVGALAGVGVM
ncbi:MAG: ABC transporter permease, partial [Arthrobacter sp.]|nr:ABC transporter permease [Arthrobacter sp.]